MADPDPFDLDPSKPRPATLPRPVEKLWAVQREHVTWTCELRYHGEWGVEAVILRDGERFGSQRFQTRAEAVAWAEEMRAGR